MTEDASGTYCKGSEACRRWKWAVRNEGRNEKNINNKFGRNNEIPRKKLIKRKHRYYANGRWKRTRPFSDVTSSGLNRD